MKNNNKIKTTYPIRKIPYVPSATRNMPFTCAIDRGRVKKEKEKSEQSIEHETTTIRVIKEVSITHNNSWSKRCLKQLAEDICCNSRSLRNWDLKNIVFSAELISSEERK
jgi:hypothetical protein